jgi:sulfhydrogenase subunit delta
VEGSITTAHDAERLRRRPSQTQALITIGACATAGGIQALRNFAIRASYARVVYAHPEYLSTAGDLHAHRGSRAGRLRAARLPGDKQQLLDVILSCSTAASRSRPRTRCASTASCKGTRASW